MPEDLKIDERSEQEMFPEVECGAEPCGNKIIVQLKFTPQKVGRFIVVPETQKTQKYQEVIAKVVKVGPVAFRSMKDLSPWPEGEWVVPGDHVRVAKYGGDRWSIPYEDDHVHFIVIYDHEVIAKIPDFEQLRKMISFY